jgi:thiol peroxidase
MADITIKGVTIKTSGALPTVGDTAKNFILTKTDLIDIDLKEFKGKNIILNIFPSIDTPVCSASVRRFNTEVTKLSNTVVLCVSLDLPFAHARFCAAEGIKNVISVSAFRHSEFIKNYGLVIAEGPLSSLLARAVVVIDHRGTVIYSEVVPELGKEPDYDDVINAITHHSEEAGKKGGVKQQPLDRCIHSGTAEDSRLFNDDEPCDDGRAG